MATNMMSAEVKLGADLLTKLSESLSQETPIRQAMVLFTIAMAGSGGVDSATLERKLGMSAAAISRTIRVLSEVSYDRTSGYGLIDIALDPHDNRRRIMRINPKGEKTVLKVVSGLSRK